MLPDSVDGATLRRRPCVSCYGTRRPPKAKPQIRAYHNIVRQANSPHSSICGVGAVVLAALRVVLPAR